MTLAPTYLIYRTGFAPTNGTSVQVERLFRGFDSLLVHLMWDAREAGKKSVRWVINTDDNFYWRRPFGRVGRAINTLRTQFPSAWWRNGRLNRRKLESSLAQIPKRPKQAYVVCYKEGDAATIVALWDALGCPPFVLHVMDILNPELSREKTPHFARLASSAYHVFCLNQLIEDEMRRLGATSTSILSLCSDLPSARRQSVPALPLRIIISGALYADLTIKNRALELLSQSWPELLRIFPGAELHYSGTSVRSLPESLRPYIITHGFLSWDAYRQLLDTCRVAYVPVSHANNLMQFSMPSRIPDYLISGVPVIACSEEGTGIHEFFQSTPRDCTRLVATPDEFLSSVEEFAGDDMKWKRASDSAIDFSKRTFGISTVREALFEQLNAAGSLASPARF